jgi:hypothetical protein
MFLQDNQETGRMESGPAYRLGQRNDWYRFFRDRMNPDMRISSKFIVAEGQRMRAAILSPDPSGPPPRTPMT